MFPFFKNICIRAYLVAFGIHPDLWSFLRILIELQEAKECEELLYSVGGKKASYRRKEDRTKEAELATLRELFDQHENPSVADGLHYILSIFHKMRHYYNNELTDVTNSIDAENTDDAEIDVV